MTSPGRRRDRPIESVVLKIAFRAGRSEIAKIRAAVPTAVVRGGVCEIRIESDQPAEVAERAKVLLEKLKAIA